MRLHDIVWNAGCVGLLWLVAATATPAAADVPGGFIETPASAQVRGILSRSQIDSLLPSRGRFRFPAPYDTEGFRLTNPNDCGGGNCVAYVGYSYWRNTNNHVGKDTMLVLVGLRRDRGGAGPSLVRYNKKTDQVQAPEPIFGPNDGLSWNLAEGWYFSGTLPYAVYIASGSRLLRHDVQTGQSETVFDVDSLLGDGYRIVQVHSSDDDRVHSATLQNAGNRSDLGCVVYREDVNDLTFFPKTGSFDECQVDRSGQWLVIKENVDGRFGGDNRVINVTTLEERVLLDQDGAGGHSDMGHGYMIAANNYASQANTQVLWKFDEYPLRGTRLYHNDDWYVAAPNHVSHTNSVPGLSPDRQFACGSSANRRISTHANEIICFDLAGTERALVVAPVMTDKDSSGGDFDYGKQPKGNLDVTGRYFVWTSNMGSSRLDAFMVKVPHELLVEGAPVIELDPGDTIFANGFEP